MGTYRMIKLIVAAAVLYIVLSTGMAHLIDQRTKSMERYHANVELIVSGAQK